MNKLIALSAVYVAVCVLASVFFITPVDAQDDDSKKSAAADAKPGISSLTLLDYGRDIKPIIDKKCLQCHGDDVTEGELNFDEIETLNEFINPGDASKSDFYQRLFSDDEDELMPPPWDVEDEVVEAVTSAEIALIGTWINQGAKMEVIKVEKTESEPEHIAMRIWRFFGSFHPALTHFPVALFTIAAVFVVLFYRNPVICNEAAFYCLIFGTLGAVVASILGWGLAFEKSSADIFDMESEMFWHRWSGIIVAVVGVIVTWIGWRQRSDEYADGGGSWKFGVVVLAAIVGLVGFQGGELVYGEGHYIKQLNRYWPEAAEKIFPEQQGVSNSEDESKDDTATADKTEGEQSDGDNTVKETKDDEASDTNSKNSDPTEEKKNPAETKPSPGEPTEPESKSDDSAATTSSE